MSTTLRNALLATIAAIVLILGIWSGYLNTGTTPAPLPTPTPTITPTPVPTPTATPAITQVSYLGVETPEYTTAVAASSANLYLARNEVTGFFVYGDLGCLPFLTAPIAGVTVTAFKPVSTTTANGSYKGATLGAKTNALIPFSDSGTTCIQGLVWVDVAVSPTMAPGAYTFSIGDLPVALTVNSYTMPSQPKTAMYVGFTSYKAMLAYGYPSTSSTAVQGPLALRHVNMFRAHGVEPIGQRIADPSDSGKLASGLLNLNEWASGSFTQTTLTGAIALPVIIQGGFIPNAFTSAATLADWQATAKATPIASPIVFLSDEPCDKNNAADACGSSPNNPDPGMVGTLARAQLVKANFPLAQSMVTHEPTTNLIGAVDHFTPIFERFKVAGHWADYAQAPGYYLYGACPSHGSCANGNQGTPTGTPEPILDQPDIYTRMFPIVVQALGAQAGFYYDSIQSWTSGNDPWVTEYNFGGEGDGTLILPGIPGKHGVVTEQPIATVRLKLLRQGIQDNFYLNKLTPAQVKTLVPDQFKWQRSHDAIEALRRAA